MSHVLHWNGSRDTGMVRSRASLCVRTWGLNIWRCVCMSIYKMQYIVLCMSDIYAHIYKMCAILRVTIRGVSIYGVMYVWGLNIWCYVYVAPYVGSQYMVLCMYVHI